VSFPASLSESLPAGFASSVFRFGPSFFFLRGERARFRERIFLTVTLANHCGTWLSAHSRLGKLAGLTPEDIDGLRDPATAGLGSDLRSALIYVLHLVETDGELRRPELRAEVERHFSPPKVRYIESGWIFATAMNRLVSLSKRPPRPRQQQRSKGSAGVCALPSAPVRSEEQ
jgi:AhpD family alkylhydroperoxidase